ncbi:MAG: serine hydrolase domain-containing protein [Phycisphaerales bacterium]
MSARIGIVSVLAIAVTALSTSALGQPAPDPGAFEKSIDSIRSEHKIPALAAAYVRDGAVEAIAATGVRKYGDTTPVTTDDLFHIGSCTKAMTGTLAAILVEEGLIDWTTTTGERLPDLADAIRPEYREVTLEEWLAHRGGLPEDGTPKIAVWSQVLALEGDMREQRRALVRIALAQEPAAKRGERTLYSNYGYGVAAAMLESAADAPWEELIESRLFEPLEMSSAGFGAPGVEGAGADDAPSQPWGHASRLGMTLTVPPGPRADNPPVMRPAGGVHLSLTDWAKFAALHIRGANGEPDLLLSPDSFEKLHTRLGDGEHGLGWVVAERPWAGGKVLTHAGSNTMWFAVVWLAPERNAAFLAATNYGGSTGFPACDAAIGAMIGQFLAPGAGDG